MEPREILANAYHRGWLTAPDLEQIDDIARQKKAEQLLNEIVASKILTIEQIDEICNFQSGQSKQCHDSSEELISITVEAASNIMRGALGIAPQQFQGIADRYQIFEKLGQGRMGIVYKAYDSRLKRFVALKRVLIEENQESYRCFTREAQAIAQLSHSHIIRIFEVEEPPVAYFTMEYVAGENLKEYIGKEPVRPMIAAALVEKIADALDEAHHKGIIHRDIKPSNIILGKDQEPKIADFGLARWIDSSLSESEHISGTPPYMSPEQICGRPIDARSDVYSLGATLYEVLTRRPPFIGGSLDRIFYQVIEEEPIPPSRLNPDVPPELDAICCKSLEKSPHKRYQSARDMGDDLARFRRNEPVHAVSPGTWRSLRKWISRHRFYALAVLALFLLAWTSAAIFFVLYRDSQRQKQRAERQTQEAEQAKRDKQKNIEQEIIKQAKISLHKAEEAAQYEQWQQCGAFAGKSLQLLWPFSDTAIIRDLRDKGQALIDVAMARHGLLWEAHATGSGAKTGNISYNPDGSLIATLRLHEVMLWDAATGQLKQTLRHSSEVLAFAFSPDGRVLVCGGNDNIIYFWQLATGKIIRRLQGNFAEVRSIAYHPDNSLLAFSWGKNPLHSTVEIWDLSGNNKIAEIVGGWSVDFSANGRWLAFISTKGTANRTIGLWNVEQRKIEQLLPRHPRMIRQVRFSDDSKFLASMDRSQIWLWPMANPERPILLQKMGMLSAIAFCPGSKALAAVEVDSTVTLRDLGTAKVIKKFARFTSAMREVSIAVSPHGTIICASADGSVQLWNTKKEITKQRGAHVSAITAISFTNDDQHLVTAGSNGNIHLWKTANGRHLRKLTTPCTSIYSLLFHPDGRLLFSGDNCAVIWDLATNTPQYILPTSTPQAVIALSPNGQMLAVSDEQRVTLWHTETGEKLQQSFAYQSLVYALAFSPDGKTLAAGGMDEKIHLWDVVTGEKRKVFTGHSETVSALVFSPDGKFLASASWDRSVRLWTLAENSVDSKVFAGHQDEIAALSFHPDGSLLATASADKTIVLWNLDGQRVKTWNSCDKVRVIAFSNNGETLACGSAQGQLRLWMMPKRKPSAKIELHDAPASHIAFSPDGNRLAAESQLGTVRIWDVAQQKNTHIWRQVSSSNYLSFPDPTKLIYITRSAPSSIVFLDIGQTRQQKRELAVAIDDCLAVSRDTKILAFARNRDIVLWNLAENRPQNTLVGHQDWIRSLVFAPDGTMLVSSSRDKQVILWDVATAKQLRKLQHPQEVAIVTFHPSGKIIASAFANSIALWNTDTGEHLATIEINIGINVAVRSITAIEFSPNGRLLACGAADGVVHLLDIATRHTITTLQHSSRVETLAFQPDSKILAVAAAKEICLWQLSPPFGFRRDFSNTTIIRQLHETPEAITSALFSLTADDVLTLHEYRREARLREGE